MTSKVEKAIYVNDVFSQNFNSAVSHLTEAASEAFVVNSSSVPPESIFCIEEEVLGLLLAIDTNKASGPDGISGKMLRNTAFSICPILTKIFNLSIKTGKVRHKWKVSSVVPVPKCSIYTDNLYNYRSITLLPVIRKLLEKRKYSLCNA